ncbi:MAG: phosphoribosylformylglycinamidine synthase subunit PurQ [Actinobacteria bacterium]|nr:phosphoribosylformylglycinamidine synthase subunit PurQ [Actinomycetota bacterium]
MGRVGVITFLGSLDDRDAQRAVEVVGGEAVPLWHGEADLKGVDAVLLPGGFSYGDHLRCGALARFTPIMAAVADFAAQGGPVLGICNGFQILCEAGLLPGVLTPNHTRRFICRDVDLVVQAASPWLGDRPVGASITVPIKHGDGAWYHPDAGLAELEANGQILLRYAEEVNGATDRIACVTNAAGNVCGLMPHPEHAVDPLLGSIDGRLLVRRLAAA